MMNYEEYLKRIEGTYAKEAFDKIIDDLDEDDAITRKERDTLKLYTGYNYRCFYKKKHTYSFKGKEVYVEFSKVLSESEKKKLDYEPHLVARLVLKDWGEDGNLILTPITTIVIKPGIEIKESYLSFELLEGGELKAIFYPRGQPEA